MVGARPGASITLYLSTEPDPYYDPIYDATLPIVVKYASMIWTTKEKLGVTLTEKEVFTQLINFLKFGKRNDVEEETMINLLEIFT